MDGQTDQLGAWASRCLKRSARVPASITKDKGDARCRFDYLLYKLRGQETVPPNMHHVADGGRCWRRVNSNVWIYSIVGL
jgi:hypothetical protein